MIITSIIVIILQVLAHEPRVIPIRPLSSPVGYKCAATHGRMHAHMQISLGPLLEMRLIRATRTMRASVLHEVWRARGCEYLEL